VFCVGSIMKKKQDLRPDNKVFDRYKTVKKEKKRRR